MASGDVQLKTDEFIQVLLTDAAVATENGVWVDLGPYRRDVNIHVSGITTGTVQIFGASHVTTQPDAATDHTQIGSNVTADAHLALSGAPRWIKAKVSAWTEGTFNVGLVASRQR